MKQRYIWTAILEDKSTISEFNSDGSENNYETLPREKIEYFGLQSPTQSYFIDLKDGSFKITNNGVTKNMNIQLPIGKKNAIQICTRNSNGSYYEFRQVKNAGFYASMNGNMTEPEIEEQQLSWYSWKNLSGIGEVYIETTLFLPAQDYKKVLVGMIGDGSENGKYKQPVWKSEKTIPQIKVFLKRAPNTKENFHGSPFVFYL